jgi:hypothetical protein
VAGRFSCRTSLFKTLLHQAPKLLNHMHPCLPSAPCLHTTWFASAFDIMVRPQSTQEKRQRLCSQMRYPSQTCHVLIRRPCSQLEDPPELLHWLLRRLCSPKKLLHWLLRRLCSQLEGPSQPLHEFLSRPCSQMEEPPHPLHLLVLRPCSQVPATPHYRHRCFWRFWGHFLWIRGISRALGCSFACRLSDAVLQEDALALAVSAFSGLITLFFLSSHKRQKERKRCSYAWIA